MKLHQWICGLIVLSLIGLSPFRTSAQQKHPLPDGLNEDSSLSEIVQWLDRTSFGKARIRLEDAVDNDEYIPPMSDYQRATNTFVFAPGFKVTNIAGCTIALKNDDARIISKSVKVEESTARVAQLNIELHRMSPTKGRSPYRYTKDPESSCARRLAKRVQVQGDFYQNVFGAASVLDWLETAGRLDRIQTGVHF